MGSTPKKKSKRSRLLQQEQARSRSRRRNSRILLLVAAIAIGLCAVDNFHNAWAEQPTQRPSRMISPPAQANDPPRTIDPPKRDPDSDPDDSRITRTESSDDPRDPEREQIIKVDLNDRVTMHVADLPLSEALRMLSAPSRRNIIVSDGIKGSVTASLYNVTFDAALDVILSANRLGYRKQNGAIVVYPVDELAKVKSNERKLASRVFRLTYMNAASVKDLITPLMSAAGKISVTPPAGKGLTGSSGGGGAAPAAAAGGGGGSGSGGLTDGDSTAVPDALLVTDYTDRLDQIADVIRELDAKPKQVLIEATILRASLNEDNTLGIDFTTVGGVDFNNVSAVSPAAQSVTTGNIPSNRFDRTNFTVRSDFNSSIPPGGFTFGILKNNIGVFLRALESVTDTSIVANPKILALNKQIGQVIVGRRDGYFTTTNTQTATIQTVQFLETGTVLTFRPFISDDGTVRMEIHPKDSTGGVTSASLPFEQTTEVTTNILVRDGHTILIGGLFREVSTAGRDQMPLLGDIPGVGALFRRTRDDTTREEVIVLLTVHIVKGEPEEKQGEQIAEDVERLRIGMRSGLQWFGRERLAEAHYHWAMEHYSQGHTGLALWDATLAMENHPRHVQAMKLREKILERRQWESEAAVARSAVNELIVHEHEKPDKGRVITGPFGRPAIPEFSPKEFQGPTGIEEDDQPEAESRS